MSSYMEDHPFHEGYVEPEYRPRLIYFPEEKQEKASNYLVLSPLAINRMDRPERRQNQAPKISVFKCSPTSPNASP